MKMKVQKLMSFDEMKKAFQDGIKKERQRRRMTQRELAKLLGTTQDRVCKYEKGYFLPTTIHLTIIARRLGMSTDKLLGIKE